MTKDHLVEEKTSLQKSLLYYESQHGRPVMLGFISNCLIVCIDSSNSQAIVRPEFNAGVGVLLFPFPKHKGIYWPPCCHLRNLLHWLLKKRKKYVLIGPLFRNQQVIGVCKVMGCHLVPYMSVRQRDVLKINKIIEFPVKRPEMLFWISQKRKWKASSHPSSLQFHFFLFFAFISVEPSS